MFSGSIVALVTPMRADGAVDFEAIDRLVDFHVANGTDAIVSVGTTGESPTLDVEEHMAVVKRTLDRAAGRIPVIAGTGANSTREAIEWTGMARDLGVAGCLIVTPYYNKPTQEGLYRHYRAIAEAVAIPQLLYNVPGRTGVDMKPDTVARLSQVPNIIGIKEASGSLDRNRELVERLGKRFLLLGGDDDIACESVLAGFKGVISVTANVAPRAMHDMCVAALAGDAQRARAIDATLRGLHKYLFIESNPTPAKWALARMGFIEDALRLPLVPLSDQYKVPVLEAMQAAGIAFA
jgi:4-hydroxy-tetrahydrodipicolinate synthase